MLFCHMLSHLIWYVKSVSSPLYHPHHPLASGLAADGCFSHISTFQAERNLKKNGQHIAVNLTGNESVGGERDCCVALSSNGDRQVQ